MKDMLELHFIDIFIVNTKLICIILQKIIIDKK